jgi:tetratricopeptide (TPR) repeat protein
VLRIRRQVLGEEHPDYAWSMFNYADFLVKEARYPEAADWSRRVLALRGKTLDDPHPAVSTAIQVLGRALAGLDSLEQAEALLRESLALRREHFPPGHWIIASSVSHLGAIVARAGRFAEAESLLVASERELLALRGPQAQPVKDARKRLVDLYVAWGKPEEAEKWREVSPES